MTRHLMFVEPAFLFVPATMYPQRGIDLPVESMKSDRSGIKCSG